MRLLAGGKLERDAAATLPGDTRAWTGLTAGPAPQALLTQVASPDARQIPQPLGLGAKLRPYQRSGLSWLHFLTQLGLGACLADDMGLGKTVQVIALLLTLKGEQDNSGKPGGASPSEKIP